MDNGWRRNKYGGLFNLNEYMNSKIGGNGKETFELFHGSSADFNEFDDKYIGANSRGGLTYGKGHYFLNEQTGIYGEMGYRVRVSLTKPFIVQEREWSKALEKIGYNWYDSKRLDPSDFLSKNGYDGTIIKNDEIISEAIIYTNKDKKIKIIEKIKNY